MKSVTKSMGEFFFELIKYLFLIIAGVVLTIVSGIIMGSLQSYFFVPENYIMWVVGGATSSFFIYLAMPFAIAMVNYNNIKKVAAEDKSFLKIYRFVRKYRRTSIIILLGFFVSLGYYLLTNISVISKDQIVTHGIFHPMGKKHSYSDIKTLHTGLYNKTIPFTSHQKGGFYYVIELKNGKRINLAEIGAINDYTDSC